MKVQPEEPEPAVGGLPPSLAPPTASAFNFVQEDELEADEVGQEEVEEVPVEVDVEETVTSINVNGHTIVEDSVTITTTTEVRLNLNAYKGWQVMLTVYQGPIWKRRSELGRRRRRWPPIHRFLA